MKEKFEGARVPNKENKLSLKTVEFDGREVVVTDSRDVAKLLGKEHFLLLREIEGSSDGKTVGIIPTLENAKFAVSDYYLLSSYSNPQTGRKYKCYLITKMGCELLGNKQQGEKGILFSATYVKAFNDMQESLKGGQCNFESQEDIFIYQLQEQKKMRKQLNEVNHHVLEAKSEVRKLEKDFVEYKENDTLSVAECEELSDLVKKIGVARLGGKDTKAYKDKAVRMSLYKNIWGNVKTEFNVTRYKQIKRKYFNKAREIILSYETPTFLKEEIRDANNQIDFLKNIQASVNQTKLEI